ncbi:HD domain-containing protein [Caballeronia sp. LZ034LL]|uniref:phosphorylase family protein n=1 Tax=Caballeronia sp. LZ034LL TaxID=3038567 RepID=UPI002857AD6E|nr:HD domain-containing protein [Caballeronia sp. LZ034LL]MDR5836556.1 HD domain-containing protein [Caballeronia sp. LZ034LL]
MNATKEYDIVFVIALDEEAKILQKALQAERENETSIGVFSFSDLLIDCEEFWRKKHIGLLLLGDQGPEKAAGGSAALLQQISTRILVSIGISGRLSSDCALGDVVIAQSCLNYVFRTRISRGSVDAAGDVKETTNIADVMGRLNQHDYLQGLEHQIDAGVMNRLKKKGLIHDYPHLHYGDIASGPYLVDNQDFQAFIKRQNRLLLAVDMESQAILESASNAKYRGATFVLRGVSDLADGTKAALDGRSKGRIRNQSMRAAVAAFKFILEDCIDDSIPGELNAKKVFSKNRPVVDRLIELVDKIQPLVSTTTSPDSDMGELISAFEQRHPFVNPLQLSEFAFRLFLDRTNEIPRRLADRLRSAPVEVRELLTAYFVIQAVRWSDSPNRSKAIQALQNVYPANVNKYCKILLNIELKAHRAEYFQKLVRAYGAGAKASVHVDERDAHQRAQVAYLMGRIAIKPFADEAALILMKWRDELLEKTLGQPGVHEPYRAKKANLGQDRQRYNFLIAAAAAESNEFRLLLRTIQISLIQLGHMSVSDDFIMECMASEKYDGQNRGFHLEYYGDIPYNIHEKLSNYDDGTSDFSRTFKRLRESLDTQGGQSPMHDVQLYTLISLAHNRLLSGTLDDARRAEMCEIVRVKTWRSDNPELEGYRLLVKEHFEAKDFRPTYIVEKLFSLKKSPRRGWNDTKNGRYVPNPETIGSHTFGTMTLAYMLLPETDEARQFSLPEDYSKETILKYLLVHDFAEAWIGDLLPGEKSDLAQLDEMEAFRKLAANYSYGSFSGRDTYRDWNSFQNGTSINSILARDFDMLDNLVQLNIEYRSQGNRIPDHEAWIGYIERRISSYGLPFFRFLNARQFQIA